MRHIADGRIAQHRDDLWLLPRFSHLDTPMMEFEERMLFDCGIRLVSTQTTQALVVPQPSWVRVEGEYLSDNFRVDHLEQLASPQDFFAWSLQLPPADDPVFQKPRPDSQTTALEESLFRSGEIVSRRYLQATDGSWRVIIAASDPEKVRALLGPRHGRQLTVLKSSWTWSDYEAATIFLGDRLTEWGLSVIAGSVNDLGVERIIASPRIIDKPIRTWLSQLPPGLVELTPFVRPGVLS